MERLLICSQLTPLANPITLMRGRATNVLPKSFQVLPRTNRVRVIPWRYRAYAMICGVLHQAGKYTSGLARARETAAWTCETYIYLA